jgi:hypothetical protein
MDEEPVAGGAGEEVVTGVDPNSPRMSSTVLFDFAAAAPFVLPEDGAAVELPLPNMSASRSSFVRPGPATLGAGPDGAMSSPRRSAFQILSDKGT